MRQHFLLLLVLLRHVLAIDIVHRFEHRPKPLECLFIVDAVAHGEAIDGAEWKWSDAAKTDLAVAVERFERTPDKGQMLRDFRLMEQRLRDIPGFRRNLAEPLFMLCPREAPAQGIGQFFVLASTIAA